MDRITLTGIRAHGRHGNEPAERERPQPFDIQLTLDVNLERASRSDDLADTVDYARLYERIVGIVADTSYALIERLASDLLDVALEDARVTGAEVTVAKPGILNGATPLVTVARRRSA